MSSTNRSQSETRPGFGGARGASPADSPSEPSPSGRAIDRGASAPDVDCHFALEINAERYLVYPDPAGLVFPFASRVWRLVPSEVFGAGIVNEVIIEHADPEDGCSAEAYLGLSCTCRRYESLEGRMPCPHLVALTQLGLTRPAPSWSDYDRDTDEDPVRDRYRTAPCGAKGKGVLSR